MTIDLTQIILAIITLIGGIMIIGAAVIAELSDKR